MFFPLDLAQTLSQENLSKGTFNSLGMGHPFDPPIFAICCEILPNVPTRTWGNSPLMNTHRVYSVCLLGLQTSLKLSVSTPAPPGIEPSPHLHPHPPWPGWRALIFSPHSRGERLDVLTLSQEQISLIHKTEPYHILRMSSHRDSLIHHPQIHSNCFNANPNILWSNLIGLNMDPFQSVLSNLVFPSPLYKKHPVPPAPPLQPSS